MRGSECATLCFCMHQNGEGKLSKCAKINTRCSLCPKWSVMCTNLPLYAIIAPLCTFITKKKKDFFDVKARV